MHSSMRRRRTAISTWPAIADLMTVIAILTAVIALKSCGEVRAGQTNPKQEAGLDIDELKTELDEAKVLLEARTAALERTQSELNSATAALEEIRSELRAALARANPNDTKGVGKPPCLGLDRSEQPNSLFTITVLPNSQFSISDWSRSPVAQRLQDMLGARYDPEPGEEEFKALGALISDWGDAEAIPGEPCNFWVRILPNGISPKDLWDEWRWIGRYFGGTVNPSVFRSY